MVLQYGLNDQAEGQNIFSFLRNVQTGSGDHTASIGYRGCRVGVKRPGREAKCLHSFSALAQKRCVAPVLRTTAVATWTGTAPLAGARPDPRDLCLCVFVFMSN